MNQKSVRITGALAALSALAAAVVAVVAVSSSGILSAQGTTTTRIDLLNVGMCVTTDDSVFKEADCDDGDGNKTFNVGDRDEIVERETVYATYAVDPISGNSVRGIVTNSDLLKISITDPGRDRRRTVLYPVSRFEGILSTTAVLTKIRSELGDSVDDEAALTKFHGQHATNPAHDSGIKVRVFDPAAPGDLDAEISQSGTSTLVLFRAGGTRQDYPFQPLSVKTDDEDNYVDTVQWYGYVVDSGDTVDAAYVASNASTLINLGSSGSGTERRVVNLIADEDRTSGSTEDDIAPWMVVQANVQPGKKVVIVAVAYETSEREVITGGVTCGVTYTGAEAAVPNSRVTEGHCKPNGEQTSTLPNFTTSELSGKGSKLVAEVRGVGAQSLRLSLKETKPFTGTYTGFVRLTDANGNGRKVLPNRDADDDIQFDSQTPRRLNWGHQERDARPPSDTNDPAASDAAFVGVSGTLKITYKDSKGNTNELRVEIDDSPPDIRVTSPEDGSSDDDRSPDFIGTIDEHGSGLAEDTFRLYVDNIADEGVGAPGSRSDDTGDHVLNIPSGVSAGTATKLAGYAGYRGWSDTSPTFGVLVANRAADSRIYYTEDGTTPRASLTNNTAAYKIVLADDYDDGDQEAIFDADARIEGTAQADETIAGREIEVDFQALVIDLAGNVGFSDSDPDGPSLIDDLGNLQKDRVDNGDNGRIPNVLGIFSRHVILLDDKDPEFHDDYPALTGFYGLDSDDEPVRHDRGIMITFDNTISRETITANTFTVELDDKSSATVDDVIVEGNLVFLRLTADLKTSATPKIGLASGHRVEDLAGNQLHAREVSEGVEAIDGLPPTLTVTLSGGSGTGEGKESSSGLTDETMEITVTSDEDLGEVLHVVLCPGFRYSVTDPATNRSVNEDIDDFVENRTGSLLGGEPAVPTNAQCATGTNAPAVRFSERGLNRVSGSSNTWRYRWTNRDGLSDGELTLVVYGRDGSVYRLDPLDETNSTDSQNWSAITAKFTYDTELKPLVVRNEVDSGEVLPGPGDKVSENRPYIILRFTGDSSTVSLQKLQLDGRDVTSRADSNVRNEFIYVPESLDRGKHKVEVDAIDAAGNETTFRYEFEVTSRAAFGVRLYAGWNAISLPQEPVDGSLENVFKDPAIDQVISFERKSSDVDPEWAYASRQDGVWTTSYGSLTNIRAGLGYWVHAKSFVTERVPLRGPDRGRQESPLSPIGITTGPGWNFVGVVDQDGDQTEGDSHWGLDYQLQVTRRSTDDEDVTAKEIQTGEKYLGDYFQAYTWDATRNNFKVQEKDLGVKIGAGIWVFYRDGASR